MNNFCQRCASSQQPRSKELQVKLAVSPMDRTLTDIVGTVSYVQGDAVKDLGSYKGQFSLVHCRNVLHQVSIHVVFNSRFPVSMKPVSKSTRRSDLNGGLPPSRYPLAFPMFSPVSSRTAAGGLLIIGWGDMKIYDQFKRPIEARSNSNSNSDRVNSSESSPLIELMHRVSLEMSSSLKTIEDILTSTLSNEVVFSTFGWKRLYSPLGWDGSWLGQLALRDLEVCLRASTNPRCTSSLALLAEFDALVDVISCITGRRDER